jgi:hypothetical protein
MYKYLEQDIDPINLDEKPFCFKHKLLGHPALELENLSNVLVNLPENQVMYSKGLNDLNANFDRAHIDQKNNLTIEETIQNIKSSNSYIMVRCPEKDPSFKELHKELIQDVESVMRFKGVGNQAIEPKLYLFIASPNAFTPFHIDRYSTFLFQFRGTKEVAVYPQWDESIIPHDVRENFADFGPRRPEWKQETDHLATKFNFKPGEGLHIPFISGHYIKNGAEDVSISMSIIFRTQESQMWQNAMAVNNRLRTKLNKVGINVNPVGTHRGKDEFKNLMYPALNVMSRVRNFVR